MPNRPEVRCGLVEEFRDKAAFAAVLFIRAYHQLRCNKIEYEHLLSLRNSGKRTDLQLLAALWKHAIDAAAF